MLRTAAGAVLRPLIPLLVFVLAPATAPTATLPGRAMAAASVAPPTRPGPAYWLASADGGVFAYGRAPYVGGAAGVPLRRPVVGIAAGPEGDGYWLVGRDGGVFAYGAVPWLGGAADLPLRQQVVDIAPTRTGRGYWLVSTDGGVFAYGDAGYFGSAADQPLRQAVTAIVASPTGAGYWLVARDGGVFAYGDAGYFGSPVHLALRQPVVDMAATPTGAGYWLVGADGGVFAYGDARFGGSALGATGRPAVGITGTHTGRGYWLASADGGVFAFGDAGFYGSAADAHPGTQVVGIASGIASAVPARHHRLQSTFGWDVSWPQCGGPLPGGPHAFAIVGVTRGHAYSVNPCLAEQHRWAMRGGSLAGLYLNVNFPPVGPPAVDLYGWGAKGAAEAVAAARARGVHAPMWWLDVEILNRWTPDTVANRLVIQGAIDELQRSGLTVGIYSTPYQWRRIAGDFAPRLPTWVAGPRNIEDAARACAEGRTFGDGPVWLVQYPHAGYDGNLLCPAGAEAALRAFRLPPLPPVPQLPPLRRVAV